MEEPENKEAGWKPDPADPSKKKWWNGREWATTKEWSPNPSRRPSPPSAPISQIQASQTVEASPLAIGLSVAGASLVVIGVFLPRFDKSDFPVIVDNSLIQGGWGYLFIALALIATFLTYRFVRREGSQYSVLTVGVIMLIAAIFMGTGGRMTLESQVHGGFTDIGYERPPRTIKEQASPGIGIFSVGAGGLLVTFGGALLAGLSLGGVGTTPVRHTKTCPDCAETVRSVLGLGPVSVSY